MLIQDKLVSSVSEMAQFRWSKLQRRFGIASFYHLRVGPGLAFIEVVTFEKVFRWVSMKKGARGVLVAHGLAGTASTQDKIQEN
jgi:hypothetical protein